MTYLVICGIALLALGLTSFSRFVRKAKRPLLQRKRNVCTPA